MNGKQRYIGLVIFLVAAISAMVWAYGFVTNRQQLSLIHIFIGGNTSGATAISSVIVEAPDFHIWQLADGSWSITKLVKPSDPNKSGTFDGAVTVNDGRVALRTKDGIKRNVENLDGTMALDMSGMSKGAFTADVDGSAITLNGKIDMNNVSNFDLFVQADEIDTAGIMSFVPLRKDLSVTSGKLQDLHLNLKSEDGKYIMSGNVGFKGLTGKMCIRDRIQIIKSL